MRWALCRSRIYIAFYSMCCALLHYSAPHDPRNGARKTGVQIAEPTWTEATRSVHRHPARALVGCRRAVPITCAGEARVLSHARHIQSCVSFGLSQLTANSARRSHLLSARTESWTASLIYDIHSHWGIQISTDRTAKLDQTRLEASLFPAVLAYHSRQADVTDPGIPRFVTKKRRVLLRSTRRCASSAGR
jgi:hypothetical protein